MTTATIAGIPGLTEADVTAAALSAAVASHGLAPAPAQPAQRPNRFGGTCPCGAYVKAGMGVLTGQKGSYGVRHHGCTSTSADSAPQPAAEHSTSAQRPNKFAGPCQACKATVPAGEGTIKKVAGKWQLRHVGPCIASAAAAEPAAPPEPLLPFPVPGAYQQGENLYIVRQLQNSSKIRAWRIVETHAVHLNEYGAPVSHDLVRVFLTRRASRANGTYVALLPEQMLSLDAYMALNIKIGVCMRCGRPLKAADTLTNHPTHGPDCWDIIHGGKAPK